MQGHLSFLHGAKLMRLDWGRPEFDLNRIQINFFDPNPAVQSIIMMISIRTRTEINQKRSIISKIG